MTEKSKFFGFGSSVKRFKYLGLHPSLIQSTGCTNSIGPGHYNPKFPYCSYKTKTATWKTKLESEEFSKYLGFKHPKLLCERTFERTLGGPGTYEIFGHKLQCRGSCLKNVGFGTGKRFAGLKDETLPPGAHSVKQQTTKFSTVPSFEWSGVNDRFKNKTPAYQQAPNRYTLPHPSITDKVVSKRGPYDTFTGPRDETTIRGYFAPPLFRSPDTFYAKTNSLDNLLHHPGKKRCGRFLLEERFPEGVTITATKKGFTMYEVDEDYPGPAYYDVSAGIKEAKPSLHPFGSSNIFARPPPNWKIHPGPDRYKIKEPTCHKKRIGGNWMFKSKVKRELAKKESYCNFIYDD